MNLENKITEVMVNLPIYEFSKHKLLECPHCKEVCAYEMPSLSSNCMYVCDYCEGEF